MIYQILFLSSHKVNMAGKHGHQISTIFNINPENKFSILVFENSKLFQIFSLGFYLQFKYNNISNDKKTTRVRKMKDSTNIK